MKNPLLPCILASAVVGGGAAFLTGSISGSSGGRDALGADSSPTPTGALAPSEVEARMAALERRNDELQLRIATLEERPAPVARAPVQGEGEEAPLAVDEETVRQLLASFQPQGEVTPLFIDRVGRAMDAIQEEEQRKRDEEQRLDREKRLEDRLAEWRQDLGLSQYQVDEMRTTLSTADTKRAELWDSMRDGEGDRGSMRDAMREIHETSDAKLQQILDPDQYQRYQESQQDRWGGGFGGFGRGGDRGPGGPPDVGSSSGTDRGSRRRGG